MQITVAAHAHSATAPERATLHMRLGVEGTDKKAALEHTTSLVKSFANAVEQMKSLSPSPVTWSAIAPIGTRSWRPWSNDGTTAPLRHSAESAVKLKFHDFGALSRFIDQWGGHPGVSVDKVLWTLTEHRQEQEEDNALTSAVMQAHARAATMARAAGERAVRFLELADQGLLTDGEVSHPHAQTMALRSGSGMRDEGVTIAPEDVEIDVVVHARFTTD